MQDRKNELLRTLAKTIKASRGANSISKLSREVDVSKSIWSNIERGSRDVQLTTLWRICEAMNIKPSTLILSMENELGEQFSFLEDTPAAK